MHDSPSVRSKDASTEEGVMRLPVQVLLPYLWGEETFRKDEWGYLNFLVGPNGTGKTLFAEQLNVACQNHGLRTRYLSQACR